VACCSLYTNGNSEVTSSPPPRIGVVRMLTDSTNVDPSDVLVLAQEVLQVSIDGNMFICANVTMRVLGETRRWPCWICVNVTKTVQLKKCTQSSIITTALECNKLIYTVVPLPLTPSHSEVQADTNYATVEQNAALFRCSGPLTAAPLSLLLMAACLLLSLAY